MLSDIVGRNKILLHQSPDNWESAIELAAKPLLANNYIKADYNLKKVAICFYI